MVIDRQHDQKHGSDHVEEEISVNYKFMTVWLAHLVSWYVMCCGFDF